MAYFSTSIIASRLGPAKPRAIAWNGAGGCVIDFAGPATELLSHMLGHEPLPGDDVERLGDVLADLGELAPAAAQARRRRRVNNPSARQIGRKVAPRPRAPREALHVDARRLGLRRVLARRRRQLLELQFQLINEPLAALGARTKHRALHLLDHQLQMRDQRFRARQLGTRLNQRRLQRRRVLGKMIRRLSHDRDDSTVTPICAINSVRRVNEPQLVQRSSGRRRPPGVLGIPPIDPVQHISELRRRDRYHAGRGRWPNKPATLQPLGVKRHANAVMPENLYQRTIAPPENVQIAGVRVALQRLLNLQGQAPHCFMS